MIAGANDNGADTPRLKSGACAECGKPVLAEYKPFCSKRCADLDLHRWLNGAYAIPVVEEDKSASEGDDDEA